MPLRETETDRQTDRQTERERERERVIYIHTHTHIFMCVICVCMCVWCVGEWVDAIERAEFEIRDSEQQATELRKVERIGTVCIYVYTYIFKYIYIYLHTHAYTHTHTHIGHGLRHVHYTAVRKRCRGSLWRHQNFQRRMRTPHLPGIYNISMCICIYLHA